MAVVRACVGSVVVSRWQQTAEASGRGWKTCPCCHFAVAIAAAAAATILPCKVLALGRSLYRRSRSSKADYKNVIKHTRQATAPQSTKHKAQSTEPPHTHTPTPQPHCNHIATRFQLRQGRKLTDDSPRSAANCFEGQRASPPNLRPQPRSHSHFPNPNPKRRQPVHRRSLPPIHFLKWQRCSPLAVQFSAAAGPGRRSIPLMWE
jgi:hypothetical protein